MPVGVANTKLGAFKQEQGRVGRAGPPGNFGPQSFRPVRQGCRLAFRGIGPCRRFWLFGPTAGVAGLPRPAAYPFAPRGFGLGSGPQCAGLFQSRRGSSRARRKPSGPCRPARLLLGFQAGSPAFVFGPVGGQASPPTPAAQPGAQGDAGLRFGLFPPSSVRPRPLAPRWARSRKSRGASGGQVRR